MKNSPDGTLILLGEENSGRDVMNLAGNPFALLQAASKSGQTFIHNEYERTLDNGRVVTATWDVSGHGELGLPGPSEEILFLVLLQITRESANEQGVWPQVVTFSEYDVLERLSWTLGKQGYRMLSEGMARLQSVSIQARYSFWDAEKKEPARYVGFALIDNFQLNPEPAGRKSAFAIPKSTFKWNDTIYASFLAGNVRSLALDFTLSLGLPTSRRLFRFLDMMRGATSPPRREFAIGLFKLCERLGMTSYKYASKIKEKLQPAIEELKERNYIDDVRYATGKDGTEIVYFAFVSITVQSKSESKKRAPKQLSLMAPELPPTPTELVESDIRADAVKCYEIFQSLAQAEQTELLTMAKEEVSPVWHDRVGQPESPMSLGLWKLVSERYPDRVKQ